MTNRPPIRGSRRGTAPTTPRPPLPWRRATTSSDLLQCLVPSVLRQRTSTPATSRAALYSIDEIGRVANRRRPGLARLRQSDRARRAQAGRNRARPGLRRRHRRAALGQTRRPDRLRLWPRHDRRDAGARRAKQAQRGAENVRVPQGPHRAHPAARQHRRRVISNCVINLPPTRDRCCARPSGC